GQEAVRGGGETVAALAGVEHQYAPPCTCQLQRSGHAGIAAADDDHIKICLVALHDDLRECWRSRRLKSAASSASVTLPRRFTSSASASLKASSRAPLTACSTRQ